MLLPFMVRTAAIYTIGIEYLGVDSLFSSLLTVLSLSELGFSSAVVYSMYKPIAEGDDVKVRALLTFYKRIYRVIGCVVLCIGLLLMPFLEWFIPKGAVYPSDINIRIAFGVLLLNTCSSYLLYAYKSSILVATMRNDIDSLLEMFRSVASHLLQIIVLLAFRKYYYYILVLPVITIITNIVRSKIIDKKFPQFMGEELLSKKDRCDIMKRVGALIGNKIGAAVFASADTIIISKFLGLVCLARYTNYYTILAAVYGIESAIYVSIQSIIGNSMVDKNSNSYMVFKEMFLINNMFTCICTCCFITLYQPFIEIWVGKDNVLNMTIPILLAIYFFVRSIGKTCFVFYEAAGLWCKDFLKPYISVILNLVTNIILVQIIGLPGVIISSIMALVIVELPWETHVTFKALFELKEIQYYFQVIKIGVVTVVAGGISYYVCHAIKGGVLILFLKGILSILCAGIVFILAYFNTSEFKSVVKRAISLITK